MTDTYATPKTEHDGTRLRKLIARRGMSNSEFAEALGVTPQAVMTVWIGQGKIARTRIPVICELLNCSADELLGLRPIDSPSTVAEAMSAYRTLDQDARELLVAFTQMDAATKANVLSIAKNLAQPGSKRHDLPIRPNVTFHKSMPR